MILVDNKNLLRKHFPTVRDSFNRYEKKLDKSITISYAKNGLPILEKNNNSRSLTFHSKYDPQKEAESIAKKYNDSINEYDHIFFYGVGMGYHIKEIMEQFPNKQYSVYEPCPTAMFHYLSTKSLGNEWRINRIKNLFVQFNESDLNKTLINFSNQITGKVLLIELPSYKRLFPEKHAKFISVFKEIIRNKKQSLHTNNAYEKRWILNSLQNSLYVTKTPNILHDVPKSYFKDKPAIIVAAGPSLEQDIEHIKYIKENKLAYVFSIGSAVNALINNGIHPDATLSYDPSDKNILVFENIIENGLKDIPLIYGSTIASDVLQQYPGDHLFHMITSQDTFLKESLTPRYDNSELNVIKDAPSIAVLAIQLFSELGCDPIILAGQNLAYYEGKQYSESIKYEHINNNLSSQELNEGQDNQVKDVYGNIISSSRTFNSMRNSIEHLLMNLPKKPEVINTTKGGADIKGAPFTEIEKVIETHLKQCEEVNLEWLKNIKQNNYDYSILKMNIKDLQSDFNNINRLIDELLILMKDIEKYISYSDEKDIEKAIIQFDKKIKELQNNKVFKVFIKQMSRNIWGIISNSINQVRFENNLIYKGRIISENISNAMNHFKRDIELLDPILNTELERIFLDSNDSKEVGNS